MDTLGPLEIHSAFTHSIARELLHGPVLFRNSRFLDEVCTKMFITVAGRSTHVVRETAKLLQYSAKQGSILGEFFKSFALKCSALQFLLATFIPRTS